MPGFSEIDLVSHSGNAAAGDFCSSLNLTDISTGWTETQAVLGKSQPAVAEALETIRQALPFRLRVLSFRKPLRVRPAEGPGTKRRAGAPELASTTLRLPPQGQQLGVDGEDLTHRFLELSAALHSWACPLHPRFRNPLHPLRPWSMKVSDQTGCPLPAAQ